MWHEKDTEFLQSEPGIVSADCAFLGLSVFRLPLIDTNLTSLHGDIWLALLAHTFLEPNKVFHLLIGNL